MLIGWLLLDQTRTMLDTIDRMRAPKDGSDTAGDPLSRVHCPGCGRPVLRGELLEKGCYLCGWTRPADGEEV